MSERKPSTDEKRPDSQRMTRRISIFLILGVVAVVAIGLWLFSTWFANRYYGGTNKLHDLPPPSQTETQPDSAPSSTPR